MPIYLCSQQDVIDRFGGSAALSECLDYRKDGGAQCQVSQRALRACCCGRGRPQHPPTP